MCSECWYTVGHAPGCPNAPEPEPVYTCIKCGEGIFNGDKYYDSYDGAICQGCIEDMSVSELMELFEETFSTAEYPDPPEYDEY